MTKSIFLPNEDDCTVELTLKDKTVEADVFDLDMMIIESSTKAKENGTKWVDEFPSFFKKKYKMQITKGHALLLYDVIQKSINDLKKNLSQQSEPSEKSEHSNQQTTKTSD